MTKKSESDSISQKHSSKSAAGTASDCENKSAKSVLSFEQSEQLGQNACILETASDCKSQYAKSVLGFDIDQTLNIAKTPIPPEIANLLVRCLRFFKICPISGQKFEQFLIQIVEPLVAAGVTATELQNLHLFVAQGTQYYRLKKSARNFADPESWEQIYNYPLPESDVIKITTVLEKAARDLGYWEADQLAEGDEIIENRLSQVTFSALGQTASTEVKYAWDPDCKKRQAIVAKCQAELPDFLFEIGGTTSINVAAPGMNKEFGMKHLLEELHVDKSEVLYFGDMTEPGGNDYPVVQMGVDTITVRSHEDTGYALRGILGIIGG